MSLETYIRAMPKVELSLQFEGTVPTQTWLNLAEMNEVQLRAKQAQVLVKQLDMPEHHKSEELYTAISQWVRDPEDLIRLVYDAGVSLAKQNVKYAELGITPTRYTASDVSFEALMEALTDGRDRVKRAWGVDLAWVFNIPRDEARRADEIVRSANSPAGRRHGVVAIGLTGSEISQQLVNYERAFAGAERKNIARTARVGDQTGATGIAEVVEGLPVTRIVTAWPVAGEPALLSKLVDRGVTVDVAYTQSKAIGFVSELSEYPLRALIESGIKTTLTASAPARAGQTTTEQYLAAAAEGGLEVAEIEQLVVNGVRASGLEEDDQKALVEQVRAEFATLRAEHLS